MPASSSNSGTGPKAAARKTKKPAGTGNGARLPRAKAPENAEKRGSLHFFSCGISLPDEVVRACREADLIVASRRILKELAKELGKEPGKESGKKQGKRLEGMREKGTEEDGLSGRETLVLDARARERMDKAKKAAESGRTVVVLASGDALFHGIGSTFVESLAPGAALALRPENLEIDGNLGEDLDEILNGNLAEHDSQSPDCHFPTDIATLLAPELPCELVFHPGPTAAQALCHKLGIPLDKVSVFCCHSKDERELPSSSISRAAGMVVIYAGHPCAPEVVARRLLEFDPCQDKRLVLVASELGTPEEKLLLTNLAGASGRNFPPTSMMLLFPDGRGTQPLPLAAPDSDYHFDRHIITNRWIRPAILGALELVPGTILWDLGAGSGSVSIEASLLCPDLTVHAVERQRHRCEHIAQNVREKGLVNYHLHKGSILGLLPELAKDGLPRSVFIGGGGQDVPKILDWLLENCKNLRVTIVAVAVTLDTLALLSRYPRKHLQTAFSLSVEEVGKLKDTTLLLPEPGHRIHVFRYQG